MAKMYYNADETMQKLACNEDQLRGLVRSGKLREFRDAGKLNYRVEEVDRLVAEQANLGGSGSLSLDDSGGMGSWPGGSAGGSGLSLDDSGSGSSAGGTTGPIELSGSGSGEIMLEESGELKLSDSGTAEGLRLDDSSTKQDAKSPGGSSAVELKLDGSGSGEIKLEDSDALGGSGPDVLSLEEVDKDRVEGMKKDDTVITNIGISVFDDDDLEIAADPMAKTMLTGGDEHLGLDGSGGGSGLLDLTRESDDTSLGAELLEGIDMTDTAETVAPTVTAEAPAQVMAAADENLPEPGIEAPLIVGRPTAVAYVTPASPAFTGLLAAASIVLALLGATVVATTMGVWPGYLGAVADQFWASLGGAIGLGAICAGVGALVGMKPSGPRPPRKPTEKAPKAKKGKKGGPAEGAPAAQ